MNTMNGCSENECLYVNVSTPARSHRVSVLVEYLNVQYNQKAVVAVGTGYCATVFLYENIDPRKGSMCKDTCRSFRFFFMT